MNKWDKVTAELWVDVTPDEIRLSSLFDEIVFADQRITYRSHMPDHPGPLSALYEEMSRRYDTLNLRGPAPSPAIRRERKSGTKRSDEQRASV